VTGARSAGRPKTTARGAATLALSAMALISAGCAGTRHVAPRELALERADFVAVSRALSDLEPAVRAEVTASKAAWPSLVDGLPRDVRALPQATIRLAGQRAAAIGQPGVFGEREGAELTGPGSPLAGEFRTYSILCARGWQLIGAAITQIEHGSPAAARFARANVGLYIESVYDAHFGLSQIGKQLLADYKQLGGPPAFGASLTQAQIDALSRAYSQANNRLNPHERVRFGT